MDNTYEFSIEKSNCGIVAPAGDYKTLATKICNMLKLNKQQIQQLGLNGYDYY